MRGFLQKRSGWVLLLGAVLMLGGFLSLWSLPGRWRRAEAIAKEPHEITLANLSAQGPGDNSHVIVTEYRCGRDFAYKMTVRRGEPQPAPDKTGAGHAWIPLFPKGEQEPAPREFVVLLETSNTVASANAMRRLSEMRSVEGLAIPMHQSGVPAEIREDLAAKYPLTDFSRCIVVEQYISHEKADAPLFAWTLGVMAVLGFGCGIATFLFGLRLSREYCLRDCDSTPRARRKPRNGNRTTED